MKNLIFLLISVFCFAKGQTKDSATLARLAQQLEQQNNKVEVLIEKSEKVEKRSETVFKRLKEYISSLVQTKAEKTKEKQISINREAIKVNNPTEPVTEIVNLCGVDSIRGGWLFRLFHKEDYRLKYYKLINNEKIYLN